MLDIENENKKISLSDLKKMHQLKTSSLFQAAFEMGAVIAEVSDTEFKILSEIAEKVGLAYQIKNDLDEMQSDEKNNKSTAVTILGFDASKKAISNIKNSALNDLEKLSCDVSILKNLIEKII